MAFIDHIRRCNAYVPEDFVPWSIDGRIAGYVRRALRPVLAGYAGLYVDDGGLALDPRHADEVARTAALAETVKKLHRAGVVHHVTGEHYAVAVEGRRVASLERGASSVLGIECAGCHVNGFVRRNDGPYLWIARRSPHKAYPNQLDNFVAGGQPEGLSILDNLVKECGEEAGVPPDLARCAIPVGVISYVMATEADMGGDGLNRHIHHCFDLELPEDFRPTPVDGETAEFKLLPAAEVAALVESGWAFKFNCALVVIDFLIRHGLIAPEHPDYVAICQGLRHYLR
ncbi:MAG: DUF4743 domain-containing protein [Alphaproteobacteria bacterium]|nr:DUF4743 domain-containing protein [Alphaproteobacteria bacterium]